MILNSISRLGWLTCLCLLATTSIHAADARVSRGLIALYEFSEGQGQTVQDTSGVEPPLPLKIETASSVRWADGSLKLETPTAIASQERAAKIIQAVKKSNAFTVEAWLRPANDNQAGPARIVSLSSDPSHRNLTLGQDKRQYDVRLRASSTDANGLPSTASPKNSLKANWTHVAFARASNGKATFFIDGKPVSSGRVGGNFSNWDDGFRLLLGNESDGDRPWLGELSLVALYSRALTAAEISQNFAAGRDGDSPPPEVYAAQQRQAHLFDTQIAPLFAKHCLECHDPAIRQGGLDLSVASSAAAGGDSGPVIVPGKATDSELWLLVAAGEMPKDRPTLTPAELESLKQWIDSGAAWNADRIDPANYLHAGQAGEIWVQRLTVPEYIATVQAAVGVDISDVARDILPRDMRADGFSNTAYNLNIDLKHVEAYNQLAELIVERMDVLKFSARFSKSKKLSTDDTMRDHVAAMGQWLLRGPLDKHEVDRFCGIATTVASAGGDFEEAVSYIIQAMLQSPRFIYRIEHQRGDGLTRPVDTFELACRLSYILWGAPPDEELYRAAGAGQLDKRQDLQQQVDRMLKDPRTRAHAQQFVAEWLNLDRLANLRPNADEFPQWNAKLAADMRQETLALFDKICWEEDRPLSDLLTAQTTFATPRLAKHYGLSPLQEHAAWYDLSHDPARGGLLTHGSVLTIGGDSASMVARGLFVLDELLRGTINAPPPCVNTVPPPTKAGLTQRGIAEQRIADEKCGVCHSRFEPLAFGLERFDGIGTYSQQDRFGNPLREDGEILFPGDAQPVPYRTSADMMTLLAEHDRVRQSLTWKVVQFSLGRPLLAADARLVAEIHQAAQQRGGTYRGLLQAIVMSDLVRLGRTEAIH